MTWVSWTFVGLAWLALWVLVVARFAAARETEALVGVLSRVLPAFCVLSYLGLFLVVPGRSTVFHAIILLTHHAGVLFLLLFLVSAQYLHAEAFWRTRLGASLPSVAATYRRLWVLSETLPAAIALSILLSGLRLIWDLPESNSPSHAWLFALVCGFGLFFWDGILGYQPMVRKVWRAWQHGDLAFAPNASQSHRSRSNRGLLPQLLIHSLSWPCVFLFGVFRWDVEVPGIAAWIQGLHDLPAGWPQVTMALLLWLTSGLIVVACRLALRLR